MLPASLVIGAILVVLAFAALVVLCALIAGARADANMPDLNK